MFWLYLMDLCDGLLTHRGQFLYIFISGSQRRQADFLRELGELWIGEERDVAQ